MVRSIYRLALLAWAYIICGSWSLSLLALTSNIYRFFVWYCASTSPYHLSRNPGFTCISSTWSSSPSSLPVWRASSDLRSYNLSLLATSAGSSPTIWSPPKRSLPFIIRRMGLSFQYSLPSRFCTPGSFFISSSRRAPSLSLKASGLNTMVSPDIVMRGI